MGQQLQTINMQIVGLLITVIVAAICCVGTVRSWPVSNPEIDSFMFSNAEQVRTRSGEVNLVIWDNVLKKNDKFETDQVITTFFFSVSYPNP